MQNAAARILARTRKFFHITPILASLHWLPKQILRPFFKDIRREKVSPIPTYQNYYYPIFPKALSAL